MTKNSKFLLIRNIRGDWSLRLLYEFLSRNKFGNTFGYLDLSFKEYFPPYKHAPILISSRIREKFSNLILFKNPLVIIILRKILEDCTRFKSHSLSLGNFKILIRLAIVKDSSKLANFYSGAIPYGRFVHTTLIAKYGVKHFRLNAFNRLSNILLIYRYLSAYQTTNNLVNIFNFSHIVLINGRDACGVGAQLAAYVSKVNIITLEKGLLDSKIPMYSEWTGNMHHWQVRENAVKATIDNHKNNLSQVDALETINSQFGSTSKFWPTSQKKFVFNNSASAPFVVFFTTSERETTTCPTGIVGANVFDDYDQTLSLIELYKLTVELNLLLIIRLHPNFKKNKKAKNELDYFLNLSKNWTNTKVISNNEPMDSYDLASKARANFVFRSSLAAELNSKGVNCYLLAPNGWSFTLQNKVLTTTSNLKNSLLSLNETKIDKSGLEANVCYLTNHSKNFKFITFVSNKDNKFDTFIDQILLNIPRFKLRSSRA